MVEGMLKTSNVPPQYIGERGQYKMNTNLELKLTYILFRILYFRAEISLRDLTLVPHRYCEYQHQSRNHRPANQVHPSPNIKNLLFQNPAVPCPSSDAEIIVHPSFFQGLWFEELEEIRGKG